MILLALCWGPSFLFIKLALEEISPITLSVLRIGTGALILNFILIIKGDFLPKKHSFWKDSAVAAFFSVAFPFMLINWGQQFIDSSLGSLLNGTTPFFTVIFSMVLLKPEANSGRKVKGIVVGFVGLLVLVFPNLCEGVNANFWGLMAVVLASASYGIGWVWVKKRLTGYPSFKAPAAQLLIATLYLLPITVWLTPNKSLTSVSLQTVTAVLGLGTLGTALAFILYFKLIEKAGANYASMVTYLVPVIGVFLGFIVLNAAITVWMIAGASLILYGIYLGNKKPVETSCQDAKLDLHVLSKIR